MAYTSNLITSDRASRTEEALKLFPSAARLENLERFSGAIALRLSDLKPSWINGWWCVEDGQKLVIYMVSERVPPKHEMLEQL